MGFFSTVELPVVKRQEFLVSQCGSCGLKKTCISPQMPPSGEGKRKILIIAEAPGKDEDKEGIQLVGESGQLLSGIFQKHDINMRKDCTLTNALICRPPNNKITNNKMVDWCRPNLINTVNELKPEIIVPLGNVAIESLLGWLWKGDDLGGATRWYGFQVPDQTLNAWICPTFHPAAILHSNNDPIIRGIVDRDLEAVSRLRGRPWKKVPDYQKQVDITKSPKEAAIWLRDIKKGDCIAFDYETNMLKPDSEQAKIRCVSVCINGKLTLAFPWHGEAIGAMKRVLENPAIKKVGWNAKFEHRWSRRYGITVKGWKWDGQLVAHAIYNGGKGRGKISGLKFQAYVHLGQKDYSSHIEPYLRAPRDGGNELNRVFDAPLEDLLLYCGMDSLLEYLVDRKQLQYIRKMEEDDED